MENDEIEYAGFWIRTGAALIDTVLLLMITLPLTFAVYGSEYWNMNDGKIYHGTADILINYMLPFVGAVILWVSKAGTPGKLVLGLRVVDATTGDHLGIGQAAGRYLAYFPSMLALMMGIFWVAWDSKKQGWHDRLARTVVVRNKKSREDIKFNKKFAEYKKINYDEITEIDNLILEPLLNEIGFELSLGDEVIEISSGKIYKILKKDNKIYFSFNGEIDDSIKAINV